MKQIFSLFILILSVHILCAQSVSGVVKTDETNEVLPFTHVFVPDSPYGAFTDEFGRYSLKVPNGVYTLQYQILGYRTLQIPLHLSNDTILNIFLHNDGIALTEVVVQGKNDNLGKKIIKKVIEKRKSMNKTDSSYSCEQYFKTSIQTDKIFEPNDSIEVERVFKPVYINENNARLSVSGDLQKQEIITEMKFNGDKDLERVTMMPVDESIMSGRSTMITYNPLDFFSKAGVPEKIDIYKNQIVEGSISDRPISSPLGLGAFSNYRFRLAEIRPEDTNDTVFVVKVIPVFKQEALYEGYLHVRQSTWLVEEAHLALNPNALPLLNHFTLDLYYEALDADTWIPSRKEIKYEINLGKDIYRAESKIIQSNYNSDPSFSRKYFTRELVKYEVSALENDTSIHTGNRPMALTEEEIYFIRTRDSIYRFENSAEYLKEQDSIYNRITPLYVLVYGVGIRRRAKGLSYYINSVLQSTRPLSVGGYRQALGGSFSKEFASNNAIDVRASVNYGFLNKDWKGNIRIGYMYLPRKFARVYGGVADRYELITTNESLSAILSRSNFVRATGWELGHSMELWNGLYLNAHVEYKDKKSIENLKLADWSEFLFGELNEPEPFERYRAFIFRANIAYHFRQRYITRGRKKIVLGSDFPTLKIRYTKGIKGFFSSEIDFDQIDASLSFNPKATKFGSMNWEINGGKFLNTKNLRFVEHKYFRGSDPYIFTNPLDNFQLLGPTLSTKNVYYKGNIIHHFNGFFIDKIPFLNRAQLELIAGGGSLVIPSEDFVHGEVFLGLGRKFKLWGEILQFAVYAVSSDNTINKLDIEYKFGLNFYNSFSGQWLY